MRSVQTVDDTDEGHARARLLAHFEDNPETVFYSRQLEVLYEREYFHWVTNMQGRSVLRSVTGDLGFPRAEMSKSIRDNPNRRLSHAGVAIGDFALDP